MYYRIKEYENDYETMRPAWTPDLICPSCDYKTDFENWYNISDFDSQETINAKLNKNEVCPRCNNHLERY